MKHGAQNMPIPQTQHPIPVLNPGGPNPQSNPQSPTPSPQSPRSITQSPQSELSHLGKIRSMGGWKCPLESNCHLGACQSQWHALRACPQGFPPLERLSSHLPSRLMIHHDACMCWIKCRQVLESPKLAAMTTTWTNWYVGMRVQHIDTGRMATVTDHYYGWYWLYMDWIYIEYDHADDGTPWRAWRKGHKYTEVSLRLACALMRFIA